MASIPAGEIMTLWELLRALKLVFTVPNTDDGIILKADAFHVRADPGVDEKLQPVAGYRPPYDVAELRRLPEGSFGREYARWLDESGMTPFRLTDALSQDVLVRNVVTARYRITHDIFHLLLGFDTSLAGELGVMAFSAAQGYSAAHRRSLWTAAVFYPLYRPLQAPRMLRAVRQGLELGRQARFILSERFEERFLEPLEAVRRDLGIHVPRGDVPNAAHPA